MKLNKHITMKVTTVALGVSMASAAGTGPYLTQSLDCNTVNNKAVPSLVIGGFLDNKCTNGIPYDLETSKTACTDMLKAMKDDGRRMLHQHEKKDDMEMKFTKCTPADKGGKMYLVLEGAPVEGKKCEDPDMAMMGSLYNAYYIGQCADSSSACPPMQNQLFMGMNQGTACKDVDGGVVLTMGGGMFIDKECKKVVPGMGQMMCMGMKKDMGGSGGMGKKGVRRALANGSGGMKGSGGMDGKKKGGSGGMMGGSGGMGKKFMAGMKCEPSKDGNTMVVSMAMAAKDVGGLKCNQLVAAMKQEKKKENNMFEPQCTMNDMDMKEKQMMMLAKKCYTCEAEGKKGCGKIMDGGKPDAPTEKPTEKPKEDESGAMALALGGLAVLAMLF